jgi:hypothetical protein
VVAVGIALVVGAGATAAASIAARSERADGRAPGVEGADVALLSGGGVVVAFGVGLELALGVGEERAVGTGVIDPAAAGLAFGA